MSFWKKHKSSFLLGGLVISIAAAAYPIMIQPYMDPQGWRDIQRVGRDGIDVDKIQPGGMKQWTDPFDRKK